MSDQSPPRDETGMTWKDRLERGRSATVKGGVVGGRATGRALKVAMIETGKTLRLASKLIAIRVGEPEYHCSYEDWDRAKGDSSEPGPLRDVKGWKRVW